MQRFLALGRRFKTAELCLKSIHRAGGILRGDPSPLTKQGVGRLQRKYRFGMFRFGHREERNRGRARHQLEESVADWHRQRKETFTGCNSIPQEI